MKIIDYTNLMPGSKRKSTAEDLERMKKATVELSKIANAPVEEGSSHDQV